eukprot:2907310-Pleurochrysis_carterae.AAC.1
MYSTTQTALDQIRVPAEQSVHALCVCVAWRRDRCVCVCDGVLAETRRRCGRKWRLRSLAAAACWSGRTRRAWRG